MKPRAAIPTYSEDKQYVNVIVETNKGSRNKYAYDEDSGILLLKKVLPAGMAFPFDFGSIPGTRGDDGDPLDVLVLMGVPVCPPCVVEVHVVGVIEAIQTEDDKRERNDRLVAVTRFDNQPAEVESIKTLGRRTREEIEKFFISYNELAGKKFKILGYRGPKKAMKLIKEGEKRFFQEA
ncbi:MAG: inorganic diphosphatase [Verrucomicrobiales bacterium]|nr:inorganic diphosphatase [Verrucomicrobiales bacterium]